MAIEKEEITEHLTAYLIFGPFIEKPCVIFENDHDERIMLDVDELDVLWVVLPKIVAELKSDCPTSSPPATTPDAPAKYQT